MAAGENFFEEAGEVAVRGYLHRAQGDGHAGAGLVLTHGAGASCSAPLLVALADAFSDRGITVLCCDLPFRQDRPSGPPPRGSAERDRQGLKAAVVSLRKLTSGSIFLGGHSYGGRQSSMLAAEEPGLVERILLLSYPLHPPKKTAELRTAHFPSLQTPALFVHGSRDGFGSTDELSDAMKLIPAKTELLTIVSAGHELMTKQNREELPEKIVETFLEFL